MTKVFLSLFVIASLLISPVLGLEAQELSAEVINQEVSNYELEGIEVEEIAEIPSGLGLWWRGVKETVSLAFTFDPIKKAEKSLKYAEERMQIAEKMANQTEDSKLQVRAQQMIEKAQKFVQKVEKKKDSWIKDEDEEKVEKLIRNIASHQIRKEVIFDKIEEKIPDEQIEKIVELRDKGLENGKRLINAINNENISEDIKLHLEDIKEKIETHIIEVKEYQQTKGQLQERIEKEGEDLKYELGELNQKRREQVQEHLQDVRNLILPSVPGITSEIISPVMNQEKNAVQSKVQDQKGNVMVGQKEGVKEMNQAGETNQIRAELKSGQLEKSTDFLKNMIQQD